MNAETAASSTQNRGNFQAFLELRECKLVLYLYIKGMRDWEHKSGHSRKWYHVAFPVNKSFLRAFLSRDLSPMKLPFPDLPNSPVADPVFSSLGYEQKPAASLNPASNDVSLANIFVPLISITPSKCNNFCALALLIRALIVIFAQEQESRSIFML